VAVEATLEKTPTTIRKEAIIECDSIATGITLHENRADTRIWGGEATGA
jgi:hypothetical protein